jgi:hypothetical protein
LIPELEGKDNWMKGRRLLDQQILHGRSLGYSSQDSEWVVRGGREEGERR